MNLQKLPLEKIIFIDIETAPGVKDFYDLPQALQDLWVKKSTRIKPQEFSSPEEKFSDLAGIYSEFGKIICISLGVSYKEGEEWHVKMHSIYGHDEKEILTQFAELVEKSFGNKYSFFCGHNIREFDIPYICRRMLINGIQLPSPLQISAKKPWELNYLLDTLQMWKFGDFKNYTSLNLLMSLFDLPSPKDDIDGSQVGNIYWVEEDLDRIVRYCEKDVLAVINLIFKWNSEDQIDEKNINFSLLKETK